MLYKANPGIKRIMGLSEHSYRLKLHILKVNTTTFKECSFKDIDALHKFSIICGQANLLFIKTCADQAGKWICVFLITTLQ